MADFMDEEAVESSEEDMSEDENRTKTKSPSSKKRQSKMISSDEEEEEDDEEKAKEEMRGFIAVSSPSLIQNPHNKYIWSNIFNYLSILVYDHYIIMKFVG